MTSKPVAVLLAELGVTRSHSRPHVSNDNPYSEAAFKTLKYCPAFPDRFGCIEDARAFCAQFFDYYNRHHRHSGIALHTPAIDARRHRRQHPRRPPRHPQRRLRGQPPPVLQPAAHATQRCPPSCVMRMVMATRGGQPSRVWQWWHEGDSTTERTLNRPRSPGSIVMACNPSAVWFQAPAATLSATVAGCLDGCIATVCAPNISSGRRRPAGSVLEDPHGSTVMGYGKTASFTDASEWSVSAAAPCLDALRRAILRSE